MNSRRCPHCNCNQTGTCYSTIGLPLRNITQCYTCESIFNIDENDNVQFFHIGEKK